MNVYSIFYTISILQNTPLPSPKSTQHTILQYIKPKKAEFKLSSRNHEKNPKAKSLPKTNLNNYSTLKNLHLAQAILQQSAVPSSIEAIKINFSQLRCLSSPPPQKNDSDNRHPARLPTFGSEATVVCKSGRILVSDAQPSESMSEYLLPSL